MKRITHLFCVVIIGKLSILSQDSTLTRDFETWSSIGIQKKLLDKKLTLGLQQQFRLDNNSSRLYQYFTNIGANYEIFKNFKIGAGYRFLKDGNKTKGFFTGHRFNVDAGYSHKIDRLKLNYRFRYQNRSNAENKAYPTTKYRLRLKVNYNIKKWKLDPFAATELFYAKETYVYNYIPEITETNSISDIQKYRLQIGTSYSKKKIGEFKLFYMLEHQFKNYAVFSNYGIPVNWHIVGFNYTYKF